MIFTARFRAGAARAFAAVFRHATSGLASPLHTCHAAGVVRPDFDHLRTAANPMMWHERPARVPPLIASTTATLALGSPPVGTALRAVRFDEPVWAAAQSRCAPLAKGTRARQHSAPTDHPLRFALAAGLLIAFALNPLRADFSSDAPPTQLPALDVAADPLHPDDVTVRPYALTRQMRADRSLLTLKDSLGQAPGVLMQESFGGFEPPRLSIRGSGLQSAPSSRGVQFLFEEFPLTLADGSFNSALIDPQLFDQIEVYRGESAARHAPATLGGAFNLRLLSRAPLGPGLLSLGSGGIRLSPVESARVEFGSFGARRGTLISEAASEQTSFSARASSAQFGGYRDHSGQSRTAFLAKATHHADATPPARPRGEISLSVYHVRARYDVPGPLTLSAAIQTPRRVTPDVLRDQPQRESGVTQIIAQTRQQHSGLLLEAGLAWLRSNDWFQQLRANGISDSRSDDVTLRAAFTRRFDRAEGDHRLRASTTLTRGWRELRRFRNDSSLAGPQFGNDGLFATTAAVDLDATFHLRRTLAASAGLSGLSSRRDIADRMAAGSSGSVSRRIHSSTLQPRAELRWTPRHDLAFFVAAARAIEPPTFDDLLVIGGAYPNLTRRSQPLANQRATTIEIGTSGTHGPFGWDLTAYHGRWSNEILRLADSQGLPRGAVNAGPTRHAGVETSLHWQLLARDHRLRLTASTVWSRFTFDDDPLYGNNRLAGAPPHLGSAQLLYEHPRGFFAATSLQWTAGSTPVDHGGRMHYGGHVLTHARAGWRYASRWTVFVEVKNAFDRAHIASTAGVLDLVRNPAATAVFLPGAGRGFSVGFEWQVFAPRKPKPWFLQSKNS